jgi:glycosyltransferase involved in cell wall biosynthesis
MTDSLPISLCTFVKNEEHNIRDCIESVRPLVSEIVIVDTGSTDGTIDICRQFTDRIYRAGFTDFGSIRTLTAHLALQPWVLMLDADERIDSADWPKFYRLIAQPEGVEGDLLEFDREGNLVIDSWALPRKRWADPWMRQQVEIEAYPDWQTRLFRNYMDPKRPKIKFVRRVHEIISGCAKTGFAEDGPTIHHFQNVHKDDSLLAQRQELYERLYAADVDEGVEHEEPPVVEMDRVDSSEA